MKKTLVAIAAAAAVTGAFADVTITGIIDQAYSRTTTSTDDVKATTTTLGGQYTGNELSFLGTEDLGGGLNFNWKVGTAPNMTTSDTTTYLNNYVSYAGLSGEFGSIQAGQFYSMLHVTSATYDATDYSQTNMDGQVTQAASGSNGSNGGQLLGSQIQYTLPKIVEGLTLQAAHVVAGDAGTTIGNANLYGFNYSVGAFGVGYSQVTEETSGTTDTKKTSAGASYDLGVAKLVYSQQTRKLSSLSTTDTGTQYGVIMPFGALKVGVQATSYSMASVAAQTAGNGYNILLKYDMSKRTSVIAQTGMTKITSGTSSGDTSQTSQIGLWHTF